MYLWFIPQKASRYITSVHKKLLVPHNLGKRAVKQKRDQSVIEWDVNLPCLQI